MQVGCSAVEVQLECVQVLFPVVVSEEGGCWRWVNDVLLWSSGECEEGKQEDGLLLGIDRREDGSGAV